MKTREWLTTFATAAALLASLGPAAITPAAHEPEAKHHHDLRGVITKVDAERNEFEIKTDAGRVVLCLIDEKTTLKRGNENIKLTDVTPGVRAHCHCASLRNGRHYSKSLRIETEDKEN